MFTERRPEFVQSYARMTNRLRDALLALGMMTGGESGERLAPKLGMRVSAPTLLRHMRSIVLLPPEPIRLLGIDDFAFRRGTTYGTILVDLERHRPIDLLPDRSAATAEGWLGTHPEIDFVSRDRGGEYAAAASRGAPQAQQIADKFHLVKNLVEALDPLFERNKACLRFVDTPEAAAEADPGSAPPPAPHEMRPAPSKQAEQTRLAHRQERLQRYEQVRALRDQGFTTPAIVARVGLSRSTVNRFLAAPAFPERQRRCKEATKLDPYRAYLSEHWQEGAQRAVHLFRAITALGYTGSAASVYAYLTCLRTGACLPATPVPPVVRTLTNKHARFLFVRSPTDLLPEERTDLETMVNRNAELALSYQLSQEFVTILAQRRGQALESWLTQVEQSGLPELQRFATSIRRDETAVRAACSSEISNGQTEGQITRLKLIKRSMFGRANFDLLRLRVLYRA